MAEGKIQCLNPDPNKTGKRIDKSKYNVIKAEFIKTLKAGQPTNNSPLVFASASMLALGAEAYLYRRQIKP